MLLLPHPGVWLPLKPPAPPPLPGETATLRLELTPEATARGASLGALALRPAAVTASIVASAVQRESLEPGPPFEVSATVSSSSTRTPEEELAAAAAAVRAPTPASAKPGTSSSAGSPAAATASITIAFSVPRRLGAAGGTVTIAGVTVDGLPVKLGVPLNLAAAPNGALPAPLTLAGITSDSFTTPAVASDGTLYVPNGRSLVHVIGSDGKWQPSLDLAAHGLSLVCQVCRGEGGGGGGLPEKIP
jgi:hypothetical protein